MPSFILKGFVCNTIQGLSKCAEVTEEHSNWAEARRDAVKALSQVTATVGIVADGDEANSICQSNLNAIFSSFLSATNDYTLDSRGEIGAIVREAAMIAIQVKKNFNKNIMHVHICRKCTKLYLGSEFMSSESLTLTFY